MIIKSVKKQSGKNNWFQSAKKRVWGDYDSKAEARRYFELKILQKKKAISDLKLQAAFELLPAASNNRAIIYKCDFSYFDNELKKQVVEDVKGFETKEFKLKKKLFEAKYPEILFRLIK